jgi:hypothetical protein
MLGRSQELGNETIQLQTAILRIVPEHGTFQPMWVTMLLVHEGAREDVQSERN